MSAGLLCICDKKERINWRVVDYKCNYSAFNGYKKTPSMYSKITCLKCGRYWRTKARYVRHLALLQKEQSVIK